MARKKAAATATSGDPIVNEGRELFNEWVDAWSDNRAKYLEDVKFVWIKGAQWPAAIKQARQIAKRPCLEINQLPAYVRQVTNDQRQNRPAIRVRPVADADDEDAQLISNIIRGIEYESNAAAAYDTAFETTVVGGFGAVRIVTEYAEDESFDQVIRMQRIVNPLTVVPDPYFNEADASDMEGCFIYEEVPKDQFAKRWPNADPVDFTEDDKSGMYKHWGTGDSVVVADWYKLETKQRTRILLPSGGTIFEDEIEQYAGQLPPDPVTGQAADAQTIKDALKDARRRTVDEKTVLCRKMAGNQILDKWTVPGELIPVALCFGDEVNIEGERILQGMCRRAMDPQQMYNFWVTSATERAALMPKAPYVGYRGQFKDPKWASANDNNYPFLEAEPMLADGKPAPLPQRQSVDVETQGVLQMAQASRMDLQMCLGMFDASLGKQSNETSGIAIRNRDKQSDTGTFHYIDNLSRMIRYVGKVIVGMYPTVYDRENRQVASIKPDQTEETVTLNQPTADRNMRINDVRKGKFDVVVDTGPSYTTVRDEAADDLQEFMKAYPPAVPLIGDLYALTKDWPMAKQIADRLKLMLPPMIQMAEAAKDPKLAAAMAPLQQQMQQLQQQAQQLGQQVAQLTQQNQALLLDQQANMLQAQASMKKAEASVAEGEQKTQRAAIDGDIAMSKSASDEVIAQQKLRQSIEESEARLTATFAGVLVQFLKLQQTQVQPIGAEASGLAPTVGGILDEADAGFAADDATLETAGQGRPLGAGVLGGGAVASPA